MVSVARPTLKVSLPINGFDRSDFKNLKGGKASLSADRVVIAWGREKKTKKILN